MTSTVAVIVRCANQVMRLQSTLESISRSVNVRPEIVVVIDNTTPAAALPWIESLDGWQGVRVTRVDSDVPAVTFNAGVRASSSPLVVRLNAGDRLDARYLELASARLEKETALAWLTSWALVIGYEEQVIARPREVGAADLVADPSVVHESSMFRRTMWESLNGFDESLPVLDDCDFWLRAITLGRLGGLIEATLVEILNRDKSLHFQALVHAARPAVLRQLAERHAELFDAHGFEALYEADRALHRTAMRHGERLRRRRDLLEKHESLGSRQQELLTLLGQGAHDAVDLGDLRRTTPISPHWGSERGLPVDRHYIEQFLGKHSADVAGVVLEAREADYTRRFGGDRVTSSHVLDLDPDNPFATVITDLRNARNIPADQYDCIILTQVIHEIDDMPSAVAECARILRPGGVLLATFPCASRIAESGWDGDFWRLTPAAARQLFVHSFPVDGLEIAAVGNVLVNTAFLYGLAAHELTPEEYDRHDPHHPSAVMIRAVKPRSPITVTSRASAPSSVTVDSTTSRS